MEESSSFNFSNSVFYFPFPTLSPGTNQTQSQGIYCEKCLETFKCSKGLEIHMSKMHQKDRKNYDCKVCQKLFKSVQLVKAHIKQVHDKAAQILCVKCERYFSNKFTLQNHIKKFHPATTSIN